MPQTSRSNFSKTRSLSSLTSSNLQEKMLRINEGNPHHKIFLIKTTRHTIKAICHDDIWTRNDDIKRVSLKFKQISRKEDGHLFKGAEFYISNLNPLTNDYFNGDRTKFYIVQNNEVLDEVLTIKSSSFSGGRKKTYRKSNRLRRTRR